MNYYARITLDEGKAIALKATAKGQFEMRLLQDGKALSGMVAFSKEELPSVST